MSRTFEVPIALFDKLSGLGESVLGTCLQAVLVKVGVLDVSEPLRGFVLIEAVEKYLGDKRPEAERLADMTQCVRQAHSDLEHANRYFGRRSSCFCRDLDNGEHAQQPKCSFCVLTGLEARLKKALG